jgi:hypothetical protein
MPKVKESEMPMPTIGDAVLDEVRELKELLTRLRDEGPSPVRRSLESLGVLHDLTEDQRRKLAEIVTEFYAQGDTVKWLKPVKREQRAWAKHGRKRIRKLKARMTDASRAIEAVRSHLKKIGVTPHRSAEMSLSQALAILELAPLRKAEAMVSSLATTQSSKDVMRPLYDFLVVECGLKHNDAEVRVGKIGNYFWDWNVALTEHYSGRGENWKGCPAVRKAVARGKRTTDTLRKTS